MNRVFMMKGARLFAAAFIVMASVGLAATLAQQRPPDRAARRGPIALVGGSLIDGSGSPAVRNSVVLIRGDRIERVGTVESLPVPPGYEVISTDGMTVLPGLWDLHVHLMYAGHPNTRYWFDTYTPQFENVIMPASAEQMLMAGVTTVRDLAAPAREIIAVRKRIADGTIPGPTVYVAGPALTKGASPNAVQTLNVSGADDARAKTRQLIDQGVDWIKIITRGRKVASHAFSEAEIRQGLLAGVDDFQHLRTQTPEYPADIVTMIRERVKTGPPLYWTITAGGNGQLNADFLRIYQSVGR